MRYIDLFAGAGGLSEGFMREGFEPIAHIEMNKDACSTLKTRLLFYYLKNKNALYSYKKYIKGEIPQTDFYSQYGSSAHLDSVINAEISEKTIYSLFEHIDLLNQGKEIDLIIGGPPCQAYSIIGRARDENNMENDHRNFLFLQYSEFLKKYNPKVFVFENVPGLISAGKGRYLKEMYEEFDKLGYTVNINIENKHNTKKVQIFDASNFGVLQKRQRVIIVGHRKDINFKFELDKFKIDVSQYNVYEDLLEDLPYLNPNESINFVEYQKVATEYQKVASIRNKEVYFTTQHIARMQNERDLEIYKIAIEKWLDEGKRLNYSELPEHLKTHKNQNSFLNRFQVVNPKGCSHTLVAHISSDGHYYIYPNKKQVRSISVREAARIQSFPDDYFFEGSRTSAFKQIGNAVPPLFAQQIAKAIKYGFQKTNSLCYEPKQSILEYTTN